MNDRLEEIRVRAGALITCWIWWILDDEEKEELPHSATLNHLISYPESAASSNVTTHPNDTGRRPSDRVICGDPISRVICHDPTIVLSFLFCSSFPQMAVCMEAAR
jgi:hypothetical protein